MDTNSDPVCPVVELHPRTLSRSGLRYRSREGSVVRRKVFVLFDVYFLEPKKNFTFVKIWEVLHFGEFRSVPSFSTGDRLVSLSTPRHPNPLWILSPRVILDGPPHPSRTESGPRTTRTIFQKLPSIVVETWGTEWRTVSSTEYSQTTGHAWLWDTFLKIILLIQPYHIFNDYTLT